MFLIVAVIFQKCVSSFAFNNQHRRQFLNQAPASLALLVCSPTPARAVQLPKDEDIQSTFTGVQYRDDRIGQGAAVSKDEVIVLHLYGLTKDGSVFLDTREQGKPLLHKMGSVTDFEFLGRKSSDRSPITLGIDDGIRGMKLGGVRRVVVPSPLAYGHAGVSRYDAMQMGLLKPIPRDETLRYEVELLRCVDVPKSSTGEGLSGQACCTEPNFPCNTETDDTSA